MSFMPPPPPPPHMFNRQTFLTTNKETRNQYRPTGSNSMDWRSRENNSNMSNNQQNKSSKTKDYINQPEHLNSNRINTLTQRDMMGKENKDENSTGSDSMDWRSMENNSNMSNNQQNKSSKTKDSINQPEHLNPNTINTLTERNITEKENKYENDQNFLDKASLFELPP